MGQSQVASGPFFRAARGAATAITVCGVAAVLHWSVGNPTAVVRSLATGRQTFDQLLADAIASLGWLVLGWACVVVTIELATTIPGALGRQFSKLADVVTPAAVRRIAQAAIGITVVLGPLTPAHALAAGTGSGSPTVVASAVATPPASPFVQLDRPDALRPAPLDLDRPADPFAVGPGEAAGAPAAPVPAATFAAPAPAPAQAPTPAPARTVSPSTAALAAGVPQREQAASVTYVVRRGDALWDVAARHLGPRASAADIAREWPRWYAANRAVIGPDPNLIRPGDVLVPPPM